MGTGAVMGGSGAVFSLRARTGNAPTAPPHERMKTAETRPTTGPHKQRQGLSSLSVEQTAASYLDQTRNSRQHLRWSRKGFPGRRETEIGKGHCGLGGGYCSIRHVHRDHPSGLHSTHFLNASDTSMLNIYMWSLPYNGSTHKL